MIEARLTVILMYENGIRTAIIQHDAALNTGYLGTRLRRFSYMWCNCEVKIINKISKQRAQPDVLWGNNKYLNIFNAHLASDSERTSQSVLKLRTVHIQFRKSHNANPYQWLVQKWIKDKRHYKIWELYDTGIIYNVHSHMVSIEVTPK